MILATTLTYIRPDDAVALLTVLAICLSISWALGRRAPHSDSESKRD